MILIFDLYVGRWLLIGVGVGYCIGEWQLLSVLTIMSSNFAIYNCLIMKSSEVVT